MVLALDPLPSLSSSLTDSISESMEAARRKAKEEARVKAEKDAEWKLQEAYYKAQGCEVVKDDNLRFSNPNDYFCSHCNSLEHEFENLIDEIKDGSNI